MESFQKKPTKSIFYFPLEWLVLLDGFLYVLGALTPVYIFKSSSNETIYIVQRQKTIIFLALAFLGLTFMYFKKNADERTKILLGWTFLSGFVLAYLGFSYVFAKFFYVFQLMGMSAHSSVFDSKTVFGIGFYSLLLGAILGFSHVFVIGPRLQTFTSRFSAKTIDPRFFQSTSKYQSTPPPGLMICPYCGKQTPIGSLFCQECGAQLA